MTGKAAGNLDPDTLELAPGTEHQNLEGWVPVLATDAEVLDALEKAFDYRGDVTITCKDGSVIDGYIFDRKTGSSLADSWVRLFPKDSPEKRSIAYSEIAGLAFTGKDRAAGANWKAGVKQGNATNADGRT